MLIVALVLAAVGLAALVTAVVTSNEVLAFVCIAAAAVGVVLMIVDAIRDRHAGALGAEKSAGDEHDPLDEDIDEDDFGDEADEYEDRAHDDAIDGDSSGQTATAAGSATERPTQVTAAVSLKEAATAAHHPTAEETYERFDEVDDEPEAGHDRS